ncbi:M56 family metallopeptidase [uncultured Acetatifactor sp.]|uniref:M56 family metallopeptidase n=1 Tax=uncultured Acetatifactor sp. TaxID=1671927 RepID=UPI002604196B|nr:M56 family metallopeptidase [uncultured Acetatifactor sp.]
MSLVQMSFAGGVMILAVIVIRALAINLLPKKTFGVLWGMAVVRLMVPFSVPSALSVYTLLGGNASAMDIAKTPQNVPMLTIGTAGQPGSASDAVSVWTVIWAAGVLVCAVFFVTAYWKCRQEFQASLPVENDFIGNWLDAHPQRRKISVRQSGRFSAPLTYGLFRPVILMPTSTKWEDTESLQYVLAHEYVHIRRFDSIMKFMLIAALCAHWFNPLAWAMYILANRDIELSCDEAVVRLFGENTKAAYARTLISMEETRNGLTPLCNHFGKNAIEERITAIMKIRKITIFSFVLAGFIVIGTATAFATSANAQQAEAVEQDGKNEIIFKPDSVPPVTESAGAFFKEDGKTAGTDTNVAPTAVPVQSDEIHGAPVEKTGAADELPESNVIYFGTEAERDEHFRALDANTEKGLDRYAGFEEMYEGIDTSAPVTYIVR